MAAMFAPIIEVFILQAIFDETVAYWLLLLIGLAITVAEPIWLRNIYRRMMLRRYDKPDGFHSTRYLTVDNSSEE